MGYLILIIACSIFLGFTAGTNNKLKLINPLTKEEKLMIINKVKNFKGRDFEVFSKEIYKLLGYKVYLTAASNDGGKDIVLNKRGEKIFVECKSHKNSKSIGRPDAQKLCGAMIAENITKGLIISVNGVNKNCINYCKKIKSKKVKIDSIECINIIDLLESCSEIDGKKILELCGIDREKNKQAV